MTRRFRRWARCCVCNEDRPWFEFYLSRGRPCGSRCKVHMLEYAAAYRASKRVDKDGDPWGR